MAKEDEDQKEKDVEEDEGGLPSSPPDEARSTAESPEAEKESQGEEEEKENKEEDKEEETYVAPTQLGHKRFVYAAYLAGGILIAFVATKLIDLAWLRLEAWKPSFGEPKEEIAAPVSAVIGGLVAWKYWRDQKVRKLAEEVAEELTKVTWPTRKEVTNSTTVVIIATMFATVFFFLMDKFWSFVTNLVYGS